jgi:drug/metabolite transporter (DMT)-like permease
MTFTFALLIPLACALLYVFSAMMVKQAVAHGVGLWRLSFVSNWALVLLFVPLWLHSGGHWEQPARYWQPFLAGFFFLGGQIFTMLALRTGDVSVITPVMGTKVILVTLGSSLLRVGEVPWRWWLGAVLCTLAIGLLHFGPGGQHREVGRTVGLTLICALSYSLGDVLLQKWLPVWGAGNFLPPMFLLVGLMSVGFIPFFSAPLRAMPAGAWRWVAAGGGLLAVTNAGIVYAIGLVGSATVVNIIYSTRGLFSVMLVWGIGQWFASEEKHLTGRVLRFRLLGAGLMIAAIGLVLF